MHIGFSVGKTFRRSIVEQDVEFANQFGVRSTPTFAVNGRPIQGALPFDQFQTIIEQELQD